MRTAIEPWLSVSNAKRALKFYTEAFGAEEKYRLEAPDNSLVLQLSVQGASFWVSGGSETLSKDPENLGGSTVRMILITSNPEDLFQRAVAAGAKEIFPVGEEYGWRLGRIIDPFGLHWEIGYPLDSFYENKS